MRLKNWDKGNGHQPFPNFAQNTHTLFLNKQSKDFFVTCTSSLNTDHVQGILITR